jgi:nucleoside-diphosphate-sugar epimerase
MKVLVTGAGGFLGGAITRQLVARGDTVHSFSRHDYAELDGLGVIQFRGDLGGAAAVALAAEGCDAVFHVAAKAGSWGDYDDYYRINVVGTEQVLAACRQHGIRDLVYTSSPSVVAHTGDMQGVNESAPYPEHFEAHYPETKSRAERLVLAASCDALHTAALRPHLIWGPGDTSLLPRLTQRSRAGQLRRIRGPEKLVDVTYIDDAATAHLLAMDSLRAGGASARRVTGNAYFISSGQPIPLWEMIDHLLVAAGEPKVARSVSPGAAFLAGWVFEKLHTILGREDEPRMTRWVARVMTTAHWFDISAAKNDFGYSPSVSLDDGLARLAAWHRAQHDWNRV